MIERRMRQSIFAVASFWYTAWINAGQPDLRNLTNKHFSGKDLEEFEALNKAWKSARNRRAGSMNEGWPAFSYICKRMKEKQVVDFPPPSTEPHSQFQWRSLDPSQRSF